MLSHSTVITDIDEATQACIGGHFSILLNENKSFLRSGYGYESARAGIYAVLKKIKPKVVHVPNYICDVVLDAVKLVGCEIKTYSLNEGFKIAGLNEIDKSDILILVNYFGLCAKEIERQLDFFSRDRVVVDNSQAFFQKPFNCLANIYSPRKFLPVPDGGWVDTDLLLETAAADEEATFSRFKYLLRRVASHPAESREEYLRAENSLGSISLRSMSVLTKNFISALDKELIVKKRIENYHFYGEVFDGKNRLVFRRHSQVPLCYPLLISDAGALRKKLIDNNIFTPVYWGNVRASNDFEGGLVNETLYLPIDHRLSWLELSKVVDLIKPSL